MIRKIAHTADLHIRMSNSRHNEYKHVFNNFINSLKQETKPDLIVISGDIFHDKLNTSNEMYILAKEFMIDLTNIAPVVLIRGNHDLNIKNKRRVDTVMTLVKMCGNTKHNLTYYSNSGFYFYDENIIFVVHDHIDKLNPWVEINKKKRTSGFVSTEIDELFNNNETFDTLKERGYVFIDLFHDPINGSLTSSGEKMESPIYRKLSDFKGHIGMFGDIHQYQVL
jgi:predicted MPP superfamily phosphohydrolase